MRLREVKEEIAREEGYKTWEDLVDDCLEDITDLMEVYDAVVVKYATEKLRDAAGSARMQIVHEKDGILQSWSRFPLGDKKFLVVDRQRIIDTKIN